MTTIRQLSVIYLLCAGFFSVAIAFDRDPPLERASQAVAGSALAGLESHLVRPGIQLARDQGKRLIAAIFSPSPQQGKTAAVAKRPRGAPVFNRQARMVLPPARSLLPANPRISVPPLSSGELPEPAVAPPPKLAMIAPRLPAKPTIALVPPAATPPSPTVEAHQNLGLAELVRVSTRLKENLTHEMFENFSLFLYVSKANAGPWSQRLYVLKKDAGGNLTVLYDWPASTGRERYEIAPNGTHQHSITPRGYYELDPGRMYRTHYSAQWHEPMPYAMFFNWENRGYLTGLAIHGAVGNEIAQLGERASAGCIRIAPENAQLLFGLIRAEYKGLAPRFAFDRRTATMSNEGMLMHDAAGNLQMAEGYKVLVFIENYGGDNVVAALF